MCVGVRIGPQVEWLIREAVDLENLARHGKNEISRLYVGERNGTLLFHDQEAEFVGSVPDQNVQKQDGVWQRRR